MHLTERIEGVVFGTAIGDALGYLVEFDKTKLPVLELKPPGLYSDDTQMFLATVEGLLQAGPKADVDHAAAAIAEQYVRWSRSPENNRAPGMSCLYGCGQLARGTPWRQAGKPNGKGSGAAMRSMAYGLFLNQGDAAWWAAEHALMTHDSLVGRSSAAAVAAGTRAVLDGRSKEYAAGVMLAAASEHDLHTGQMLHEAIQRATPMCMPSALVLNEWRGWVGDEAVAAALYCFLVSVNYETAVLLAANSPGDSDTIACIAGALAGGYYGMRSIPDRWTASVENWLLLQETVTRVISALGLDVKTISAANSR